MQVFKRKVISGETLKGKVRFIRRVVRYIYNINAYLTENKMCVHYYYKSIKDVQGNKWYLFSESYAKCKYTLREIA
jgi:hypothetical protein